MYINKSFSLVDSNNYPIDLKLDKIFNKSNGFFIELGANDGLKQSNTAFLEFTKNWNGILIEPSVNSYLECKKNRTNSVVYNCCCVSNTYKLDYVKGDFDGNLMSSINGKRNNSNNLISIKARTLENILDEYFEKNPIKQIDFLSLDTEGYEYNILQGLNLTKYRPKYMLIEIYNYDYDNICNYLKNYNYNLVENISNYNKKQNPIWDETHNDYLFIDKYNNY
jgi:FkbM family methyltransferase